MKPVAIIAISVVCSVVAVLAVLALSDRVMPSEEERAMEEAIKKIDSQKLANIEMVISQEEAENNAWFEYYEELCYNYEGQGREDCFQDRIRLEQERKDELEEKRQMMIKNLSP